MNKLKELMESKQIGKAKVADACGMSSMNAVTNWVENKTQPNAKILPALFKLFGITKLDEFIS